MALISSISGLRATLGDDLTPAIVADYCSAFATLCPEGIIAIAHDGRPSGNWIQQVAAGALAAAGRTVHLLGMAPTPTVQLFAEREGFAGGISITASHNPAEYNGLKFLNHRGVFLGPKEYSQLMEILSSRSFSLSSEQQSGHIEQRNDALDYHIAQLMQQPVFAESNSILGDIRHQQYKVVVDAVHSSGSKIVPMLLRHFGCEVVELYTDGTGMFPHTPEPIPANLTDLAEAVTREQADFGIAVDPDADRLVIIDEKGRPIGEENTIVLAAMAVLKNKKWFTQRDTPSVVVNLSTTKAVADAAAKYGAEFHQAAVGEINVVESMLATKAIIGGEGSGGVIWPQFHPGRDAVAGIALFLIILTQYPAPLSHLLKQLPNYAMVKLKKELKGDPDVALAAIQKQFKDVPQTDIDGLKLMFPDSWVHMRKSNTEPIVRIIAEAPSQEKAEELANTFASYIA